MIKILITCLVILLPVSKVSGQQNNFNRVYTTGLYSCGYYINATVDGNYFLFGLDIKVDSLYPNGNINAFAIKLDSIGDTIKTISLGSEQDEIFKYSVKANDSTFITVGLKTDTSSNYYDYDIYLVKFNLNLDTLWTKAISDPGTGTTALKPHTIIKTSDGNFVIGGYQNDWSGSWFTSFLMKVDVKGNMIWYNNYTLPGDHTIWGVAESTNGDLICSGTDYNGSNMSNLLIIKTDSLGSNYQVLQNIATTDRNYGAQIQRTTANNFIAGGVYRGCFTCDAYAWAVLIDDNGNIIWDKKYAPSFNETGFSIIKPLSNNNYIGAGAIHRYTESQHGLILKMDSNGDSLWSREFFTPGSFEIFWDIDTTSDGGFVMTGETYCCNYTPGQGYTSSLWVVKTDSLGFITTGINDLPGFGNYKMGTVYPNPATTVLNVPVVIPQTNNFTATTTGKKGCYLYVFGMQGKQMLLQQLGAGMQTLTIDVNAYSSGSYVAVLVVDGYKIGSEKFVVSR